MADRPFIPSSFHSPTAPHPIPTICHSPRGSYTCYQGEMETQGPVSQASEKMELRAVPDVGWACRHPCQGPLSQENSHPHTSAPGPLPQRELSRASGSHICRFPPLWPCPQSSAGPDTPGSAAASTLARLHLPSPQPATSRSRGSSSAVPVCLGPSTYPTPRPGRLGGSSHAPSDPADPNRSLRSKASA